MLPAGIVHAMRNGERDLVLLGFGVWLAIMTGLVVGQADPDWILFAFLAPIFLPLLALMLLTFAANIEARLHRR